MGVCEACVGIGVDKDGCNVPSSVANFCLWLMWEFTFVVREVSIRPLEQEVPDSNVRDVDGRVLGVGGHGEEMLQ